MPIYQIKNISPHAKMGIWKITESTDELICLLKERNFDVKTIPTITNKKRIKQWLSTRLLATYLFDDAPTINYDQHGKPHLSNGVYISISHSHDFVTVLINEKVNCGVDIQKITPKITQIKTKFLSTKELKVAKSIEDLITFWSAKEALYKFYGKKGLIFREQLFISNFNLRQNIFSGKIQTRTLTINLQLAYEKIEDYILVYTL